VHKKYPALQQPDANERSKAFYLNVAKISSSCVSIKLGIDEKSRQPARHMIFGIFRHHVSYFCKSFARVLGVDSVYIFK